MNKYVILTDSSCMLTSKQMEEFGVAEIIPMHFYLKGKEYDADGDWKLFSAKEYYDLMRNGEVAKSAQISEFQYHTAFKKYLDQGFDVLSISCTGALSASVKESFKAKDKLAPLYPNQRIECVDSANCCYSLAMILKIAAKMREEGKTIDDIIAYIDKEKLNFNEVGTTEKLTYLRLAGRISASAAFFGGILSVKPIVVYDEVGHNVAVEKVKGRKASLEKLAEYVKRFANIDAIPDVYIAHADCLEEAEKVADMIQAKFDQKINFIFGFIEPGVGSSVGPGTLILAFYGSSEIRYLNKK